MITYSSYRSASITLIGIVVMHSVQPASVNQVTLTIQKTAGGSVKLDWGNGDIVTLNTDNQLRSYTSNYASGSQTYHIKIYDDLDKITVFQIYNEATIELDISQLRKFNNLLTGDVQLIKSMSGNLNTIRSGLTTLRLSSSACTLSGSINSLPTSLETVYLIITNGTVTGNLGLLWEGLVDFKLLCGTGNEITGSVGTLPNSLEVFNCQGVSIEGNTLTGSIDDLPSGMTEFYVERVGSGITGSIENLPVGLIILFIVAYPSEGYMNLTGSIDELPVGLKFLILSACGHFTGSVENLPSGINTTCWIDDYPPYSGNITGDIGNIPCVPQQMNFEALNLTGNIEEAPISIQGMYISNCGGAITVGAGAFPAEWTNVYGMTVAEGWTTTEVDNFLIGLATTLPAGTAIIQLAGGTLPNQARSAASNSAVATLQGLGYTVTTTP